MKRRRVFLKIRLQKIYSILLLNHRKHELTFTVFYTLDIKESEEKKGYRSLKRIKISKMLTQGLKFYYVYMKIIIMRLILAADAIVYNLKLK